MEAFFLELSIILVGSAALAVAAVILRQPIIIAYILCGVLAGPWGFGWIKSVDLMETISHLGITLLLFLAGLTLHPRKLVSVFKDATIVTIGNSVISFAVGFLIPLAFGFSMLDCLCIGFAMMFSSTILVVKLLPTTDLHHRHMGAVCIGILILQDLLAVAVLAFIRCIGMPGNVILSFMILSLKLVFLIGALVAFEYYFLRKIMAKVDRLQEALFILGLAWCFGVATISNQMGLFYETGAFFSGVVLARHSISRFISEELKPLRDFFLVLFFFTLGARVNIFMIKDIVVITLIMAVFFILCRPWIFKKLLLFAGENETFSKEAGLRLGQLSEFALLIGILALEEKLITPQASQLIQLVTIVTFTVSSYLVFSRCPTPISISEKLMKD